MTDNFGWRERWNLTLGLRTAMSIHVFDRIGLKIRQDVTEDLQPYNLKRNRENIDKLLESFHSHVNPFSESLDLDTLINITTGKSCTKETENVFLNVDGIGRKDREAFIDECAKRKERFEETITREKVCTFATTLKNLIFTVNSKVNEVKIQRDIFENFSSKEK